MDIRNHRVGIRNCQVGVLNCRVGILNRRVGILNCQVGIRNRQVSIHQQLRLGVGYQRLPNAIYRTHRENLKDPIEVLSPSRDSILVRLRVEHSRNYASLTPFDHVVLYSGHSPAIDRLMNALLSAHIGSLTHVVRCSIAPRTDLLSSSNCLPSKPRPRA